MKGRFMENTWRTAQVFLSAQTAGVFEVEVDTKSKKLRCNCPVWLKKFTCKHVAFVERRTWLGNGNYSIMVPNDVSEEVAAEATESAEKFRNFVLKHAKIEVL